MLRKNVVLGPATQGCLIADMANDVLQLVVDLPGVDQFVREHYPWIVYQKEVGQLVRGRYQSVRGRDVNLSRTVLMTGGVC